MKRLHLALLIFFLCSAAFIPGVGAAVQGPLIIDHTCTDIWQIPESAILQAKNTLHIAYGHTSHGSQLTSGMGSNGTQLDAFMTSNGAAPGLYVWHDGPQAGALDLDNYFVSGDLGNPDRVTWAQRTRDYLDHPNNADVNVVIWSWCGQVNGTESDINTYLNLMNQLEVDYPDVTFVYMTGHLDGTGVSGNVNARNNQIRAYCLSNNKVLYDFADIESYDPDGLVNYMELRANDNCDYDSDGNGSRDSNWAVDWQNYHVEGVDWWASGAAHSQHLNGNLKGYAAWWLWASLAGWNRCLPAPSNLTAVADSALLTIDLTWTDNSDNEAAFIIQRRIDGGIWDNAYDTVSANITAYIDDNHGMPPLANAAYTYRITAVNADGPSDASNESQAMISSSVPDAPSNLDSELNGCDIVLTWNDNSDNEERFVLERQTDDTGFEVIAGDIPANTRTFSDTGLAPLHTYTYRLMAVNSVGASDTSNETWEYIAEETFSISLKQNVNSYTGCRDAYLESAHPDYNYGNDAYNYVRNGPKTNLVISFDMPPALSGKKILSATIGFYCWSVSSWSENQYLDLYQVISAWEEGTVDGAFQEGSASWNIRKSEAGNEVGWSTPGGDIHPQVLGCSLIPSSGYYPEFDITDLVQEWVDGSTENFGVLLKNDSSAVTGIKASEYSEYGRPYLDITYSSITGCRLSSGSTEGGTVTLPGEGDFTYECGTIVDLAAEPEEGYEFTGWTGDVANPDSAVTSIVMDTDKDVFALFEPLITACSLSVISSEGGYVSIPGEGVFHYDCGSVVELVAMAGEGYQFSGWTGDAVVDPGSAATTVLLDTDRSVAANFANTHPVVSILAPADGFVCPENDGPITFTGTANDPEDGDISTGITWASNIDGFFTPPFALSVGTHTITASATDRGGLTGTAAVTVTITADVNDPPIVTITSPADGASFSETDGSIGFSATANDPEDGDISTGITWASNVDGPFVPPATLTAGIHTITATVTDSDNATGEDAIIITVAEPVDLSIATGVVSGVGSSSWTTVTLTEVFNSMVVVCAPAYKNNSPPMVVRVRNASGNSFDVKLDRTDGQLEAVDGIQVHYVAVEEGVYTHAEDGITLEAVKINAMVTDNNKSWIGQPCAVSNPYINPVVVGQVMTYNDPEFSVFWSHGPGKADPPNASELWIGKHVGEDPSKNRDNEVIGYIVCEAGSGSVGTLNYVAALGSDSVVGMPAGSGSASAYSFNGLSSPTSAIICQSGMDGGNGGWAVLYGDDALASSELYLSIDEDQKKDSERKHTTEQVSFIIFEETANQPPVASDDSYYGVVNTDLIIASPGILHNDEDSTSEFLTVSLVRDVNHGSLVLNDDGSFLYCPDSGFEGEDSFSYQVSDGEFDSNTADVFLTITQPFVDPDGLVMELLFNEESGTYAQDTSPYGQDNSGVLKNGAWFDTDNGMDGSLALDGIDDFVSVPNTGDINTTDHAKRSISLWFNAKDVNPAGAKQVLYEEGGGSRGLNIYLFEGSIYIGGWNRLESGWPGTYHSAPVENETWYHVVMTLDGSDTVAPFAFNAYLNGSAIGSGEGSQLWKHGNGIGIGAINGTTRFHDNSASGTGSHAFYGTIDDILLYNRVLGEDEIRLLYSAGIRTETVDLEIVYDDGYAGDWMPDQWGEIDETQQSRITQSGALALEVSHTDEGGWGGFVIQKGDWNHLQHMYPDNYETFSFYIYPGDDDAEAELVQNLSVGVLDGQQRFIRDYLPGNVIGANKWNYVEIPMTDLSPEGKAFFRIVFFNNSSANPHYYLDTIHLTPVDLLAPLTVSDIQITKEPYQLIISWSTSRATNYTLIYGIDDFAMGEVSSDDFSRSHEVTLSGLSPETEYQFRIIIQSPGDAPDVIEYVESVSTPEAPPMEAVSFLIDSGADVQPISPFIYGANPGLDRLEREHGLKHITMGRAGGNRYTAYNWETNASNAGTDWYNQNDGYLTMGFEEEQYDLGFFEDTPGAAAWWRAKSAHDRGAASLITVPILGYVAADKNGDGDVGQTPDYLNTRFHHSMARKGAPLLMMPDTTDHIVYQDEFVNFIEKTFFPGGRPSNPDTPPIFYSLDNEPALWAYTHRRIHPDLDHYDEFAAGLRAYENIDGRPVTYRELADLNIEYGSAIKDIAPGSLVFGFVGYGYAAYMNLQNAPDAAGRDFIDFYLNEMKLAEAYQGKRIIDVLDLHWYSEARGGGVRITSDSADPEVVAARVQAPRSLWDENFQEESWICDMLDGPITLIPRLQDKIDANYPNTRLAFTEYNFGGGGHISGAIAEADALGIFGREGVFAAAVWPMNTDNRFLFGAMKMFRDYDGAGSAFGDTSIMAVSEDSEATSVYASVDAADPNRMVIMAINKTLAPVAANIEITHSTEFGYAEVYQLTGSSPDPVRTGNALVSSNTFEYVMPGMSISTIILQCDACENPSPMISGCSIFPETNIWNTPVDTLPVDDNSDTYINTIGRDTGLHPDFGSGTWAGAPIGIPYVVIPGTQPKVPVTFDYASESDPGPYPIPEDPPIEGGPDSTGDRHILMVDQDDCILYELYHAFQQPDGSWHAGSGAIFDLRSNDLRPSGWTSADAAGLPILTGLIRYEEVEAGEINHAIRFTVPQTRKEFVWPARHHASSLTGAQYPPMGQRFRLRSDYDISGFSADVQVILTALKKYGMILADNGSPWFISGAPDERWDNDILKELKQVHGSAFEAVDVSSLMVSPDSGETAAP